MSWDEIQTPPGYGPLDDDATPRVSPVEWLRFAVAILTAVYALPPVRVRCQRLANKLGGAE